MFFFAGSGFFSTGSVFFQLGCFFLLGQVFFFFKKKGKNGQFFFHPGMFSLSRVSFFSWVVFFFFDKSVFFFLSRFGFVDPGQVFFPLGWFCFNFSFFF